MKKNYFLLFLVVPFLNYSQPGSESAIMSINATIPYQGYGESTAHVGTGEYKIFYDNVDGVLDKPIFFVDGFDPNDSRDIPSMYSLLDFGNPVENLADLVRDEGYDIVVLNFPTYISSTDGSTTINGGADFIQRNAFILVELINTINGMKTGTEKDVVIGPSMGGLISRYALRYMEQNFMDHETRLFLSFDSPHLGANVPIGMQYLFNYMVNGAGITDLQPVVDGLLNSAAAKQMLVDHYLAHLQNGSTYLQDSGLTTPAGAPNFRDAFQTELDAMGFPQTTRNIAISNGSGIGTGTGTPGMELINHTFNVSISAISTILRFTPAANNSTTVTGVNITVFGFPAGSFSGTAQSIANSDGIDSAPGGQFDLYSFDDGSNALITEFVNNLNSQYFCFIPTLSALATPDADWYSSPNLGTSPFAATYVPTANEPHVTLTTANVAFALDEILNPTLSIDLSEIAQVRLQQNPVSNNITLIAPQNWGTARISVVDMTGKIVLNTSQNLSGHTTIPITLASGLYVLNVESANNRNMKTKFLVR
ncbi:MAG TPA: T9SS type A sorting domain-containing protein [Mangrovimonas sp.]|nr:T9SS type A sorting domain-containing protein [Mangrovimonas sp.]